MERRSGPILDWVSTYRRVDLRGDLAAGLTVGAMLVPQAMAYALLAGLPPAVGLYSATIPILVYAALGSSRQLAVGPVALVSLLTATALASMVDAGTLTSLEDQLAAAALLALMVGALHLVLGVARLGALVNLLSHSVLVGFTAAAALIIGFSQVKHLFGVSVDRQEYFHQTVLELISALDQTNGPTLAVGLASLAALLGLKRLAPRLPAALLVVAGSIVAVEVLGLEERGVRVVGDVPGSLPAFGLPDFGGSVIVDLASTATVITLIGFMESIAVAKVYARRHHYQLEPNRELVGLGAANVASGLFGGYPVTGGFSRTAVNDAAGARTPLASVVTAAIVLATIAFLTPLLRPLPNAALGAVIITAVVGLVDVAEMRHVASVKRSDLIGLTVAFVATLALGIELGIVVAIVASMLVVFARMSAPHTAVLGHVAGTTAYRNVERFPEASTVAGVRVVRIDAALSFVNAARVKRLLLDHADGVIEGLIESPTEGRVGAGAAGPVLILDASGINDLDATGVDMLQELLVDLDGRGVTLHLSDVKGPVRDVLRAAGLWSTLDGRIHAGTHDAVRVATGVQPSIVDHRRFGIDECRQKSAVPSAASTGRSFGREQSETAHR